MFISQLLQSHFIGKSIHVFPELCDGMQGLVHLETQLTDLIVEEASNELELHDTVLAQVHHIEKVGIC